MQVLKDEVRQRILKSSIKEFRKNGFAKASMRVISANASMTVGNLYRYYSNKEELFGAVVEPLYEKVKTLNEPTSEKAGARLNTLLSGLEELHSQYSKEWFLLFAGSEGTQYRKVVTDIHILLGNALGDILEKEGQSAEIAAPLASAVLYGLTSMVSSGNSSSAVLSSHFLQFILGKYTQNAA